MADRYQPEMIQDVIVETIIPEKKTAKGRSVSQKEYKVKKKLNCIAKWTFEFPWLFPDKAANEMFCKTCS